MALKSTTTACQIIVQRQTLVEGTSFGKSGNSKNPEISKNDKSEKFEKSEKLTLEESENFETPGQVGTKGK